MFNSSTLCVGVARVGADSQAVCQASLKDMVTMDIGKPLQSLIITGKLHPLEQKMLSVTCSNDGVKINGTD